MKNRVHLKDKTREELIAMLVDLKKEQLALRIKKVYEPLKNPMQVRHVRRSIARILTHISLSKNHQA